MTKITIGSTGFDGKDIDGGVSSGEVVTITEDNSKTLYVSNPSDLPAAVGGEINITQATIGGKNVVRITDDIDLGADVIIWGDDVQLQSNRNFSGERSPLITTNAPGKYLLTGSGNSFYISNLVLSNTGAGGGAIDVIGTATPDSLLRVTNCTIQNTAQTIRARNLFGVELSDVALDNVSGGFLFGGPSLPAPFFVVVDTFLTFNSIPSDSVFIFDTSQSIGGLTLRMSTVTLDVNGGQFGIDIDDISKFGLVVLNDVAFTGAGDALSGFDSESPNVFIAENCTGVIVTPTNYWAKYKDQATQTTPIVLPNATETKITCDGVAGMVKHFPSTITDLWDTTANKIIFTRPGPPPVAEVSIGRSITVIIDVSIDVNQSPATISLFGRGLDTAQTIFNADTIAINRKNAEISIQKWMFVDVVDADLQANGIELFLRIDDPGTAAGTAKINYILAKRG
jgi:hypothetical protein